MAGERQARMADRIKVLVAERLEKGLRDPRMGFVTITDVRVTGDLQHASVFYTVLGGEEERTSTAEALRAATGMLRSEVGRQLNVRLTPTLEFIHDGLAEDAGHIEELLREARQFDARQFLVLASQEVVDIMLDEESTSVAELEEFIGKPIRFQAETLYTQEQFDVVLL